MPHGIVFPLLFVASVFAMQKPTTVEVGHDRVYTCCSRGVLRTHFMPGNLVDIWCRNRGNLLLAIALGTVASAFLLWRFDLLPKIQLQPPTQLGPGATRRPPQPARLVVTLVSASTLPASPLHGFVLIYGPPGFFEDGREAMRSVPFTLDEGGETSIFINDLPAGSYIPIAYLDINENGRLDTDEGGGPLEPVRTPSSRRTSPEAVLLDGEELLLTGAAETNLVLLF